MAKDNSPQIEADADPAALDELTLIKQAIGTGMTTKTQVLDEVDGTEITTDRSGVQVTHTRPKFMRLYRPNGSGPRLIPVANGNFERMTDPNDGGWLVRCPKCNTDCKGGPTGCGKDEEPKYYRCPVPGCNDIANGGMGGRKKFYETGVKIMAVDDPNELVDPALSSEGGFSMARSLLYAHMWRFHPLEAAASGIPAPPPDR